MNATGRTDTSKVGDQSPLATWAGHPSQTGASPVTQAITITPETEPAGRLITAAQAQAEFGVSRMSLARWAERGILTSYRTVGGHMRVDRGELIIVLRGGSIDGGDAA